MTPQLQQAIRLLQLPTIELQAHIRAALESNVMLEQDEESDTASFRPLATTEMGGEPAPEAAEARVEVIEEGWNDQSVGPAENPWSPGDDDRQPDIADERGQTLREHLLWQLELPRLSARERSIGRAIIDAINDDGYLGDSLAEVAATLRPEIDATEQEITAVLAFVQGFDPSGVGARTLSVRIPKGVTAGQTIRLAGQAAHGGNLLLEIEFAPHPMFQVEGRDIQVSLPIAPWEAALGGKVPVPTLGGNVEFTLPAGVTGGKKLRLKGRGLPGKTPGDEIVTINLVTPPAQTDEARSFYQEMAQRFSDFDPRI